MIAHWMVYLLALSVLLTASAAASSVLIRRAGRDGSRWPWLGAIVAGLAVPAVLALLPGGTPSPADPSSGSLLMDSVDLLLGPVEAASNARVSLGEVLGAIWIALSTVVAIRLVGSVRSSRRALREAEVLPETDGQVLLADFGPAVVGAVRPRVVLPTWALKLPAADRRLLVAHERSHIEAGDPIAMLIGRLATVITPWNPLTWWQLHHLREAIELDCDRRVTREHGVPAYGRVLLETGRRRLVRRPVPVLSFARSPSQLERRIRTMTRPPTRTPRTMVFSAAAIAALALIGACGMDQPTLAVAPAPAPLAQGAPADAAEPAWDQRPNLANRSEFAAALVEAYPASLRAEGISGQVWLRVHITEQGEVDRAELLESSGYPAMDEGARRVMLDVALFEPAMLRGQPIATWIELPLNFAS